jgi:hypothetical protein
LETHYKITRLSLNDLGLVRKDVVNNTGFWSLRHAPSVCSLMVRTRNFVMCRGKDRPYSESCESDNCNLTSGVTGAHFTGKLHIVKNTAKLCISENN